MNKYINFNLIEEYMKVEKLTVKEFCKRCKISVSTFYAIKQDKDVRLPTLFKLSKILNKYLCEICKI